MFGAFIVSCGFTHFVDAVSTFVPFYRFLGLVKLITAIVSWLTIIGLVQILPRVFTLKGPVQLELEVMARTQELVRTNDELQQAIEQKNQAEEELRRANASLEERIRERTEAAEQRARELQQSEEALRESESRFRNAFDHAPNGMFLVGLDGSFIRSNSTLCKIVGRSEEDLQATTFQNITHPDDLAADLELVDKLLRGEIESYELEKRYLLPNGEEVWILLSASLVRDRDENPLYFVGHVHDISERRSNEERIRASLHEKQVLLKEIHHRVKNNLQVISSLLDLQSGYSKDADSVAMFEESKNRVRSMALVHEQLYRSETLANIDFSSYLAHLIPTLAQTYPVRSGSVRFETALEPLEIEIDSAVPLGLIVNELVSNALKYAFPESRSGRIRISLRAGEERFELCIDDDGVGIPEDFDPDKSNSFGFRLVRALSKQLRADLSISRASGTKVTLDIPKRASHTINDGVLTQ